MTPTTSSPTAQEAQENPCASPHFIPPDEKPSLLSACIKMLKLTGGSQYWTGDTKYALEFMEKSVADHLEKSASEKHP